MSDEAKNHYRDMVRTKGIYCASRYMKNRGVPFETAYEVIFNRKPRA